jgi:hypothetical protein
VQNDESRRLPQRAKALGDELKQGRRGVATNSQFVHDLKE